MLGLGWMVLGRVLGLGWVMMVLGWVLVVLVVALGAGAVVDGCWCWELSPTRALHPKTTPMPSVPLFH